MRNFLFIFLISIFFYSCDTDSLDPSMETQATGRNPQTGSVINIPARDKTSISISSEVEDSGDDTGRNPQTGSVINIPAKRDTIK